MDDTPSTLDMGFRGEGLPPLTRDAESRGGFRNRDACAWHTSIGSKRGPSPRGVANTRFVIAEAVARNDGEQLTPGSPPPPPKTPASSRSSPVAATPRAARRQAGRLRRSRRHQGRRQQRSIAVGPTGARPAEFEITLKADWGRNGQLGRSCISQGLEQRLSPPIAFDLIEHGEIKHWPQGTALRQHDCIALAAEAGVDNTNRGREILPNGPGQKRFVMDEGIDRAAAQCR
jgi:hypothetical protein